MADDIQIILSVESKEVSRAVDEIIRLGKASKDTAKAFEQGFKKVVSWQEKFSTEQGRISATLEKSYLAQQKSNKSARDSARVFKLQADEVEKLSMKYKPLYASSKLYETKLQDINRAQQLGVLNDKQREASLEQLNMEFKTGTGTFATYANGMGKGANRLGVAMQQTGYQVGDFLVQVQSGQNPMVAFGQQATQLVGIMYLLPQATLAARVAIMGLSVSLAGITLGLSILIPLLSAAGAAFMRSKEAAKEASSGLEDYENGLDNIIKKTKELKEQRLSLTTDFDSDVLKASEKRVKLANRIAELDVASVGLKGEQLAGNRLLVQTLEKMLEEETKTLSVATAAAKAEKDKLSLVKENADATARSKKEAEELLSLTLKISGLPVYKPMTLMERAAREASTKMLESFEAAMSLKEELGEAAYEALRLAGVDVTSPISSAANEALRLAQNYGMAYDAAVALSQKNWESKNTMGGLAYNYSQYGAGRTAANQQISNQTSSADNRLPGINLPTVKVGSKGRSGGGGGKSQAEELSEYLQKKQEEAILQEKLLGLFGEERDIQSELISAKEKYNGVMTTAQANELEATLRQIAADKERQAALEESNTQLQSIADTMQSSMSDAFMSMVEGTKSFKDSMKDMARAVIKQLFDVLVVQKLVGSFGSGGGGILGSIFSAFQADGGAWQGGSQIKAYANGGVVGGPTYFPMSGGKTGLMGEAGPEAIMPLKRGANGKLGVQMEGSSGGDVVINQSFNFQANGDDSVKKLIAQAAPQIAQMTQKQIMDSRRRGGAMKSTFG